MKKISLILAPLVLVGLVCSYEIAKGKHAGLSQNTTSEYIIIRYLPSTTQDVVVYSGGNNIQHFELTKEQKKDFGTLNLVIDLINKYSAEGYTLVSSTPFASTYQSIGIGTQCFLTKTK